MFRSQLKNLNRKPLLSAIIGLNVKVNLKHSALTYYDPLKNQLLPATKQKISQINRMLYTIATKRNYFWCNNKDIQVQFIEERRYWNIMSVLYTSIQY